MSNILSHIRRCSQGLSNPSHTPRFLVSVYHYESIIRMEADWDIKKKAKERLPASESPFENVYSSSGFDIMGALVS